MSVYQQGKDSSVRVVQWHHTHLTLVIVYLSSSLFLSFWAFCLFAIHTNEKGDVVLLGCAGRMIIPGAGAKVIVVPYNVNFAESLYRQ